MDLVQAGLVKEVVPEFTKIESPFKLFRYDMEDSRYYLKLGSDGSVVGSYLSFTAFCKMSLPTSTHLINWVKEHGDKSDFMRDERAAYGTALHAYVVMTLKEGRVNFNECREYAVGEALAQGFGSSADKWCYDLPMDVAAFYAWYREHVVDIIGMEFPIASDKWGIGGVIDIVAMIKFNKGIVPGIVDLKSGRKGFWDSHKLQLHSQRIVWNEVFPEFPITHVFNWAPKDWRKTPTYGFTNHSGSVYAKTVISRMRIVKQEGKNIPSLGRKFMVGEFGIDNFIPENHIRTVYSPVLVPDQTEVEIQD